MVRRKLGVSHVIDIHNLFQWTSSLPHALQYQTKLVLFPPQSFAVHGSEPAQQSHTGQPLIFILMFIIAILTWTSFIEFIVLTMGWKLHWTGVDWCRQFSRRQIGIQWFETVVNMRSSTTCLKTFLRNTMGQERLSSLALMHIHYNLPINLDVIDTLKLKCNRRISL